MWIARKKNYKPIYQNVFDGFFDYGTNAVQPISAIESTLDGFLNEVDRTFVNYIQPTTNSSNRFGYLDSVPRANITKNELGYVINLAVPGLSRDDFDISVENNILTVSSALATSSNNEAELVNDGYKEFDYTNFQRSWTLPNNAMINRIEANYEAGVLVMEIPFEDVTKEKTRKIEVK
jgi:HSP20 family protein